MKTRTPGWPFFTVLSFGIAAGILIGILLANVGSGMINPRPGTSTPSSTAPILSLLASPSPGPTTPAYPPPLPDILGTLHPYPYPVTPTTPVPSSTPTVYRASIQTLSQTDWVAAATQMAPMPSDTPVNTPDAPLMPKHDLQITFVDRSHGWITGHAEWGNGTIDAMAATLDGGITWHALPVPAIDLNFGNKRFYLGDHNRIRLLFTDANTGWMYQKWLFQTHDGGQTWRQEHPRGTIIQMGKARDGTFWALEQVGKRWTLWRVTGDSYGQWTNLGYQFPVAIDGTYLALVDDQQTWMTYGVSSHQGGPNVDSRLYVTHDGGKNWASVSLPTPCDALPLAISAANAQELWIGCGVFGIAVFKSPDGGLSWYEMKYDMLGGLISLTAISKSLVYLTISGYTGIPVTYDGGETWLNAPINCVIYSPGAFFLDESYGWAACDSAVYRTTDGGRSWECINLPGEKVCQPKIIYPTETPSP